MSFTEATYRNMGEGLITEVEITQRQLHIQKFIPVWMASQKPGNLEDPCSTSGNSKC